MPQIIPIRDLKNTAEISERCKQSNEPIFVTKNGYGDMVVMSVEHYTRTMYEIDLYKKLKEAEDSLKNGDEPIPHDEFWAKVMAKYENV